MNEKRFFVAKASGSRFAYVIDSFGERKPKRFDVLKVNGWADADKLRDRLNAELADQAIETPCTAAQPATAS